MTALVLAGVPPNVVANVPEQKLPGRFRLTIYRLLMVITIALSIPATAVSLVGKNTASAIISIVAGTVMVTALFVAKEHHDDFKDWAPWLFENDYKTEVTMIVCIAIQLVLCRLPAVFCLSRIPPPPPGISSSFVHPAVFFFFVGLEGWAVLLLLLLLPPIARWVLPKSFMFRLIVEEALIFIPRLLVLVTHLAAWGPVDRVFGPLSVGLSDSAFTVTAKLGWIGVLFLPLPVITWLVFISIRKRDTWMGWSDEERDD